MPYLYNLPNNTSGMDQIIVDTLNITPFFTPLLLLFVWCIVFFGGVARQKARIGNADYSMWAVIASMSIMMIALIMSTITGIIRLDWLIIVVALTILSGVWFFLDRRPSEV